MPAPSPLKLSTNSAAPHRSSHPFRTLSALSFLLVSSVMLSRTSAFTLGAVRRAGSGGAVGSKLSRASPSASLSLLSPSSPSPFPAQLCSAYTTSSSSLFSVSTTDTSLLDSLDATLEATLGSAPIAQAAPEVDLALDLDNPAHLNTQNPAWQVRIGRKHEKKRASHLQMSLNFLAAISPTPPPPSPFSRRSCSLPLPLFLSFFLANSHRPPTILFLTLVSILLPHLLPHLFFLFFLFFLSPLCSFCFPSFLPPPLLLVLLLLLLFLLLLPPPFLSSFLSFFLHFLLPSFLPSFRRAASPRRSSTLSPTRASPPSPPSRPRPSSPPPRVAT